MIDLARYLAAKKTLDDRSLNRHVLEEVRRRAPYETVLEVGAGLGTMVARLLEWGVVERGEYVLLDVDRELLRDSVGWLGAWAAARDVPCEPLDDGCTLGALRVRLVQAELGEYVAAGPHGQAELLVGNALLDLVDVPSVLPGLLRLLVDGGTYWFTLTYDGETIFEPEHPDDARVLGAYHRDMDERVRHGRPAGESRAGRHLFGQLAAAGAPPAAAGSSDWVVHPDPDGGYPDDDAVVVASILDTIADALAGRADRVPPDVLAAWLTARRRQLAAGRLVYLAHQLDVAGQRPAPGPPRA